jgi:mannose-6-phosphate isomerase-like protein (cupin superfamily)
MSPQHGRGDARSDAGESHATRGETASGGPIRWAERLALDPDRPAKADLWAGERLFAGLNSLLPGQAQATHVHAAADKFYLVLEGRGTFEVGERTFEGRAGELVPAPAGVPHGVRNDGRDRLVLLTVMAPPPRAR